MHIQVYVDKLVKVAYENWENVVEYDGEALIGVKTYQPKGIDIHTEDPIPGQGRSMHSQGPSLNQHQALSSSHATSMDQQRSSSSSSGGSGSGWYLSLGQRPVLSTMLS